MRNQPAAIQLHKKNAHMFIFRILEKILIYTNIYKMKNFNHRKIGGKNWNLNKVIVF